MSRLATTAAHPVPLAPPYLLERRSFVGSRPLECAKAIPLLEAVEHAASRAGVPVDARVETGRTPIHALERLWNVERFDRIVIPAPAGREPGFTPKELLWMLTNAPSETLILRPDPALRTREETAEPRAPLAAKLQRITPPTERAAAIPVAQTR
jgi:hypothetical protein